MIYYRTLFTFLLLILPFYSDAQFSESTVKFDVPEDAPVDTVIGSIPLKDGVLYRIPNESPFLKVDLKSGEILLRSPLDREQSSHLNLLILSDIPSIVHLNVNILDINDNSPTFPSSFQNVSIAESAVVGTRIPLQSATDLDERENGDITDYNIISGNLSVFSLLFSHQHENVLMLEVLQPLDREDTPFYVFNISASDGGQPKRIGYVTIYVDVIDVNDNPPQFKMENMEFPVSGKSNEAVTKLSATDPDSGVNGQIWYSIEGKGNEWITVDEEGTVVTKKDLSDCCDTLPCEECAFTVNAIDRGVPPLMSSTVIRLHISQSNRFDPVIRFRLQNNGIDFAVVNSEGKKGRTIAVITIDDGDGIFNGSLVLLSGNLDDTFSLLPSSHFWILRLNADIATVTHSQFNLIFEANDGQTPSRKSTKNLTVYIEKEKSSSLSSLPSLLSSTVSEDAPIGSFVLQIQSKVEGTRYKMSTSNENFIVDSESGIVTTNTIFDVNKSDNYSFSIEAILPPPNIVPLSIEIEVKIEDVNNHSPHFLPFPSVTVVPEDTRLGSTIMTIGARDEDRGPNRGILFSINEEKTKENIFRIDSKTGTITLAKQLDYEKRTFYDVHVTACDSGTPQLCNSTNVPIYVQDINDNSPFFPWPSQFISIPRNIRPSTDIFTINAIDNDSGLIGQLHYLIYNAEDVVSIDGKTGVLSINYVPQGKHLQVTVAVHDGGNRFASNNATVHISFVEVEDTIPIFLEREWTININGENSGKVVGKFPAVGASSYEVIGEGLNINEKAELSLEKVDNSQDTVYFTVVAISNLGNRVSQYGAIHIAKSPEAPRFPSKTLNITVSRETPSGRELYRVNGNGEEGISDMRYTTDCILLNVNEYNGVISLKSYLGDQVDQLQCLITARDSLGRSDTLKVMMKITNNEQEIHLPSKLFFDVEENTSIGHIVSRLGISEKYIFSTNQSSLFGIFPNGDLYVRQELDRELNSSCTMTIEAIHREKGNRLTSKVTIRIIDVNDNDPECSVGFLTGNVPIFTIPENSSPGETVGTLYSIDKDERENGMVKYQILDQHTKFTVEEYTGKIRLLQSLDSEVEREPIKVKYSVSDRGIPMRTKDCHFLVNITDVNDNSPIFTKEFYSVDIDGEKNEMVTVVNATDEDSGMNGIVRYAINNYVDKFNIDSVTGRVSTISPIPSGIYNLSIIGVDMGVPSMSTHTFILINVREKEDIIPVFQYSPSSIGYTENTQLGDIIGYLRAVAGNQRVRIESTHPAVHVDSKGNVILSQIPLFSPFNVSFIASSSLHNSSISIPIVKTEQNAEFSITSEKFSIEENLPNNSLVGILEVSSFSSLSSFELLFTVPDTNGFLIDGNRLMTTKSFDREIINQYQLFIRSIGENGKEKATGIITVDVLDVNDNQPICNEEITFTIDRVPIEIPLGCEDKDKEENGTLTYKMEGHSGMRIQQDGHIIVNELPEGITIITVNVTDMALISPKSVIMTVRLIRIPQSEEIVFKEKEYLFEISTSLTTNSTFGKVEVTTSSSDTEYFLIGNGPIQINRSTGDLSLSGIIDRYPSSFQSIVTVLKGNRRNDVKITITFRADSLFPINREVVFSMNETTEKGSTIGWLEDRDVIFTSSHPLFSVHAKTGEIKLSETIEQAEDFYKIPVQITKGMLSARVNVFVVVRQNLKNNGKGNEKRKMFFFVRENSEYGTIVGQITHKNVTNYSINGSDVFTIDEKTGVITTNGQLDREKREVYSLIVKGNSLGNSLLIPITIFVEDENDNSPEFNEKNLSIEISENMEVGEEIVKLKWRDEDIDNFFSLQIIDGNPFNHFSISSDGSLRVKHSLDREKRETFTLRILIKDDIAPFQVNSAECIVTIHLLDVNDNSPLLHSSSKFVVPRMTAVGTVVGTVMATDEDEGINGQIQYRILPNSLPIAYVTIDPSLGYLTLTKSLSNVSSHIISFIVIARDFGSPEMTTQQEITLMIGEPFLDIPLIEHKEPIQISENTEVGTLISQILPANVDEPSLVFSTNSNVFKVVGHSGSLILNEPLDYENQTDYKVQITVTNMRSGRSSETWRTIEITDENDESPTFLNGSPVHFVVSENGDGPYPMIVGTTIAEDNDKGEMNRLIAYSMVKGNNTVFMVNSTNGYLMALLPLDREEKEEHLIVIEASDSGFPRRSFTSEVFIHVEDINDNIPRFSPLKYFTTVIENSRVGTHLLTVSASDADSGRNGEIRYSIVNGADVPFLIDKYSGELTVSGVIDREKERNYDIVVKAEDNGRFVSLSSSVIVYVEVDNVNDNSPVILNQQLDLFVPSSIKRGELVSVVDAYDPDDSSTLLYNISGNDVEFFKISQTGVIYARKSLSSKDHYTISASVFDQNGLNTSSSFTFYTQQPDLFPTFLPLSNDTVEVKENYNGVFSHFSAVSKRPLPSGFISYSIVSGNGKKLFSIDSNGNLRTNGQLDREDSSLHRLTICASDQGNPQLSTYQLINIIVTDENDNKPRFEKVVYEVSVMENSDPICLLNITVKDRDEGRNGEIEMKIVEGNEGEMFGLDGKTGELCSISSELDREKKELYVLIIEAIDKGIPQLRETTIVKIHILDEDDNPPRFTRLFHRSISESIPIGFPIVQIESEDPDGPSNHTFSFDDVTNNNESLPFYIDPNTGMIYLEKKLDREITSSYRIRVRVNDGSWSVQTTVSIDVEDVNDNQPIFDQQQYLFIVDQRDTILYPQQIGSVKATDSDEGDNSLIVYRLQNDYGCFHIDPLGGNVSILCRPSNCVTELTVIGMDKGVPSLSSSTSIRIVTVHSDTVVSVVYTEGTRTMGLDPDYSWDTISILPDLFISESTLHLPNSSFNIDEIVLLKKNETSENVEMLKFIKMDENITFIAPRFHFVIDKSINEKTRIGRLLSHPLLIPYHIIIPSDIPFIIDNEGFLLPNHLILTKKRKISFEAILMEGEKEVKRTKIVVSIRYSTPQLPTVTSLSYRSMNSSFVGCLPNTTVLSDTSSCDQLIFSENGCITLKKKTIEYSTFECDIAIGKQENMEVVSLQIVNRIDNIGKEEDTVVYTNVSRRSNDGSILYQMEEENGRYIVEDEESVKMDREHKEVRVNGGIRGDGNNITVYQREEESRNFKSINIISNYLEDGPPPIFDKDEYKWIIDSLSSIPYLIKDWKMTLPEDWKLQIGRGNEKGIFCINDGSQLSICNEPPNGVYTMTVDIVSIDGRIASNTVVEVIIDIEEIQHNELSPSVIFIRENTPEGPIFQFSSPFTDAQFMIASEDKQFFSLSSLGILSTKKVLDFESKSLHILPISVITQNKSETSIVRLYVDDEVDQLDENINRNTQVHVFKRSSEDPSNLRIFPSSKDPSRQFQCKETNEISERCVVKRLSQNMDNIQSKDILTGNILPYNITTVTEQQKRDNLNSVISLHLNGMNYGIGEFIEVFKGKYPDMSLHLISSNFTSPDSHLMNILLFDRNKNVIGSKDAFSVMESFTKKNKDILNVYTKSIEFDHCLFYGKCGNGGECTVEIEDEQGYIDYQGRTQHFVVPNGGIKTSCQCQPPFSGSFCQLSSNCHSNNCQNGNCSNGICVCSNGYKGNMCEIDIDECETMKPCLPTETCINTAGSFKCLCKTESCQDNSVSLLNNSNDTVEMGLCDSATCVHGICSALGSCECHEGFSGLRCSMKVFGFQRGSSMEYSSYETVKTVSIEMKTLTKYAHIFTVKYSIGGRKRSVSIVNGRLHLQGIVGALPVVNDGLWKRIRLDMTEKMIAVDECSDEGHCERCNSSSCSRPLPFSFTIGNKFLIGTIDEKTMAIRTPHFIGCIREVIINNEKLYSFKENKILKNCPKGEACAGRQNSCFDGVCIDDFEDTKCVCREGYEAKNCRDVRSTISLSNSHIILRPTHWLKEQFKIEEENREADKLLSLEESSSDIFSGSQWIELDYRSTVAEGVLLTMEYEDRNTTFELRKHTVVLAITDGHFVNISIEIERPEEDGQLHKITMEISEDRHTVSFQIDGGGKEGKSIVSLPSILSPQLEQITIGGITKNGDQSIFQGCLRRLVINNQAQNLLSNGETIREQFFETINIGNVEEGCSMPTHSFRNSLISIGIATFFVLIIGILLAIAIRIWRRTKNKESHSNPSWRGITSPGWQPAKGIDAYVDGEGRRTPLRGYEEIGGYINRGMTGRSGNGTPISHTYERTVPIDDQFYEIPQSKPQSRSSREFPHGLLPHDAYHRNSTLAMNAVPPTSGSSARDSFSSESTDGQPGEHKESATYF